jgi:RNA polymerase sigma-70 factor, ECF subfamily
LAAKKALRRLIYRRSPLATQKELSDFLESVETKAFKQACFAVRNEENALDLVQDAMIRLAEKYGNNSVEEFPMLFQRILQNAIRDFYRRTKVRSRWTTLFSSMVGDEDESYDFLETLDLSEQGLGPQAPDQAYSQNQMIEIIEAELEKLPQRQREAFIMRYWLDLDVAETAAAMGCTDGSVKTHCSRATHTLAIALKKKGISL